MNEIETRPAKLEDMNFIYSTWLRSYRHASQFARRISNDIFYYWHHKVIDRLIERGSQIRVAHPAGEPDVVLGFICTEPHFENGQVVHYCYVKKPFRRLGVARKLMEGAPLDTKTYFTHWTADTDWVLKKHPNLIYDPYLI